jgi:O-antigen biosynthesis protein
VLEFLRRAGAVYDRFRRNRLEIVRGPIRLDGPGDTDIGYLDQVVFAPNGVEIVGWTRSERITLRSGPAVSSLCPAMSRADVPDGVAGAARGFSARLAVGGHPVEAQITVDETDHVSLVPLPGPARRMIAEVRVAMLFSGVLLRHLPQMRNYLLRGDQAAGNLLRAQTGLFGDDHLRALSADIFRPDASSDAQTPFDAKIVVVLPVYGQVAMVDTLLARLAGEAAPSDFSVVVIDDASPEPEMAPTLRRWRDSHPARFEIVTHERNLGFVAAANRGLSRASERGAHAVLLNSDALPPPGWLGRLIAPILTDASIATVTPFSNDAEILSVPAIARQSRIGSTVGDAVDRQAQRLAPSRSTVTLPIGIGFCMAMNSRFLDAVPGFDTSFGRGYGEEVDWCRKASALGGRHVGLASLFVHHIGGASFGSAEKTRRVTENNARISRRYPRHDAEVQRFIETDPAFDQRFALALALTGAETDKAVPVIVAHSLGGGAETWLRHHLEEQRDAGAATIVLRVGGPMRWRIELHRPDGTQAAGAGSEDEVAAYLSMLPRRYVVYSCGVGTPDPKGMVSLMDSLSNGKEHSAEVLFHDFFPLSPNYTLLGPDGVFDGVPDPDSTFAGHHWPGLTGLSDPLSLAGWRAMWRPFLEQADRLRVFSADSAGHVARAYPGLSKRLDVSPHRVRQCPPRLTPPAGSSKVIGVLGNLNRAKGAEVVASLSDVLQAGAAGPTLAHLGNLDPAYRIARGHVRHGAYRLADLPALVARYRISCWLMPSVWPETFSFATHEILATGLPVFCFPLGAQAEVVAKAENGHVLTADPRDSHALSAEISRIMGW